MTEAPTGRIFLSYRRQDTAWQAVALYHRLAERFGEAQIFKDADNIRLGEDFTQKITQEVESCDILLALIGNSWLVASGEDGARRLDDPRDFVRLEIEAALGQTASDSQGPRTQRHTAQSDAARRASIAGLTGAAGCQRGWHCAGGVRRACQRKR